MLQRLAGPACLLAVGLLLAGCGGGDMMQANPVCTQPMGKGGMQLAPMYKCTEGRGARLENAR